MGTEGERRDAKTAALYDFIRILKKGSYKLHGDDQKKDTFTIQELEEIVDAFIEGLSQ